MPMISHADEVLDELERKKKAALEAVGTTCTAASVRIVTQEGRVDSGEMRGSIGYQTDKDTCYVGTNSKYANIRFILKKELQLKFLLGCSSFLFKTMEGKRKRPASPGFESPLLRVRIIRPLF